MKTFFTYLLLFMSIGSIQCQIYEDLPMLSQHYILGSTYNIFGNYPNSENNGSIIQNGNTIMPKLYNKTKFDNTIQMGPTSSGEKIYYSYPSSVNVVVLNSSKDINETAESTCELEQSISANVTAKGHYGYFSGSVSSSYSTATESSEQQYYSLLQQTYLGYIVELGRYDDTSAYSQEFIDSLLYQDPVDLFEYWGTHIVTGIVAGLAAKYECYAEQSEFSSKSDFSVSAQAKYNNVVKGGTFDASGTYASSSYQQKISAKNSASAIGGDTPVMLSDSIDVTRWKKSFWDESRFQAFTDISDGGLVPIWEVLDVINKDRADELQNAFEDLYTLYHNSSGINVTKKGSGDLYSCEAFVDITSNNDIPIGFGIKAGSSKNISHVTFKLYNTSTQEISYREYSDGTVSKVSNPSKNYDRYLEVPNGCVITGIGIGSKLNDDNDIKIDRLNVWYQQLDYTRSPNGYLGETVYKIHDGSGSGDKSYEPNSGNPDILSSFGISVDHNGEINDFIISHVPLQMNADPNDIEK